MLIQIKQRVFIVLLFFLFIICSCSETGFFAGDLSSSSYKQSTSVIGVEFSPLQDIVLAAKGSDNWPITWGSDDMQYTSYGDGWGFKPFTEKKLSLGLAIISGDHSFFKGENLRSESGEKYGDGKKGIKASGMLMVDKILYMLVRNIDGRGKYSQLLWSEDLGKKWHKAFELDKNFGCPTFLNYGRNYTDARDIYVYIYSHQGPSSYKPYDHIVLARVHKNKISDTNAYEFYAGSDDNYKPIWTKNSKKLKPVFSYPKHCARMDVIYNSGLKKYLLILSYNGKSGWGIYEADEPWGSWSTVYHTQKWDVPGVHGLRIPTKWISKNGRKAVLVFSGSNKQGYDAFCIRNIYFKTQIVSNESK